MVKVNKISNFKYTIFNRGTAHSFHPAKKVIDKYTNTERTLLDIHMDKVREEKHPLVYIIDEFGRQVSITR